jgi:hypothetical protein
MDKGKSVEYGLEKYLERKIFFLIRTDYVGKRKTISSLLKQQLPAWVRDRSQDRTLCFRSR